MILNLPIELIKKITTFIKNKETILSLRLVSKLFYNEFNIVYDFDENYIINKIYEFNDINYICKTPKNKILKKIIFLEKGEYKYYKYNEKGQIILEIKNQPPFNITIIELKSDYKKIKKEKNILNDSVKTTVIPLYPNFPVNCIIS